MNAEKLNQWQSGTLVSFCDHMKRIIRVDINFHYMSRCKLSRFIWFPYRALQSIASWTNYSILGSVNILEIHVVEGLTRFPAKSILAPSRAFLRNIVTSTPNYLAGYTDQKDSTNPNCLIHDSHSWDIFSLILIVRWWHIFLVLYVDKIHFRLK